MSYLRVPGLAPAATELLASEPALLWSAAAGRAAAGPPAIGDSVIAIVTTDGTLIVLSRVTGEKVWSDRLDSPGIAGPLVSGNRVFSATADGHVYAHDLPTGRTVWDRRSPPLVGPLSLAGGYLIVATAGGQVTALETSRGMVTWRRELGRVLRSGAAIGDGRVVIASDDSLHVLDLVAGALLLTVPARGMALNPPAQAGNLLIYGSPEGAVAAFDASTLAPAWRVETGDPVLASAVVTRDTAFAITAAGTLWSIPLASPQSATRIALEVPVRAAPAPIADGIILVSMAGEILRITPPLREPRWRTRVDGPLNHPPVVDHGLLVFVDGRGRIQAWR